MDNTEILETVEAYCVVGNHGDNEPVDFKLRDFDAKLKRGNPLAVWLKREDIPYKSELKRYGHKITKCKIVVYRNDQIKTEEACIKARAMFQEIKKYGRNPFPPQVQHD